MGDLVQHGGLESAGHDVLERLALDRAGRIHVGAVGVGVEDPLRDMHHLHVVEPQPEQVAHHLVVLGDALAVHLALEIRHDVLGQHPAHQRARPLPGGHKFLHPLDKGRPVAVRIARFRRILGGPLERHEQGAADMQIDRHVQHLRRVHEADEAGVEPQVAPVRVDMPLGARLGGHRLVGVGDDCVLGAAGGGAAQHPAREPAVGGGAAPLVVANPIHQVAARAQDFARAPVGTVPHGEELQVQRAAAVPALGQQQAPADAKLHRVQIAAPVAAPVFRGTVGPAGFIDVEVGAVINAGDDFPRMVGLAIGIIGQPFLATGGAIDGHVDIQFAGRMGRREIVEIDAEIDAGPVVVAVDGHDIARGIRAVAKAVRITALIQGPQIAGRPILKLLVPHRAAGHIRILVGPNNRPRPDGNGPRHLRPPDQHRPQHPPPNGIHHPIRLRQKRPE